MYFPWSGESSFPHSWQQGTSLWTRGPGKAVFLARKRFNVAVPTVICIAATAAASLASLGTAAAQASNEVKCALGDKKQDFSITKPGGTLQVQCLKAGGTNGDTGKAPQICVDNTCSAADNNRLQLACPGGQATTQDAAVLAITCPQLPNTTTSIIIRCAGEISKRDGGSCDIELTVSAPPPEGPQACVAAGTTVTLAVHGEGAQTQFACASTPAGLTTLNPPQHNKVYKEDCSAEEDLKDLKLTKGTQYHILAAIKKPRSRKLCYLCKASTGDARTNQQCRILIDVSAGSGRSERSALGLALCCALGLLHLI